MCTRTKTPETINRKRVRLGSVPHRLTHGDGNSLLNASSLSLANNNNNNIYVIVFSIKIIQSKIYNRFYLKMIFTLFDVDPMLANKS